MGALRILAWLALGGGCGRLRFDAATDAGDAASVDGIPIDAPVPSSCVNIPANCGSGTTSCCESPAIPGGMFLRSFDVAPDMAFPDRSFPATVSDFRLDTFEVTVGRYRQFVMAGMGTQTTAPSSGAGEHPHLPGSGWDQSWNTILPADTTALVARLKCDAMLQTWTDPVSSYENRPINCVSWYEAMAFCIWDGGYLPTEAEWNYAASGGSEQRALPWSNPPDSLSLDAMTYASYWVDSTRQCFGDLVNGCSLNDIIPVGTKPDGIAKWGQADMGGNMWEWVHDWASAYTNPCVDCVNEMGTAISKMKRGGSFYDVGQYMRTAPRVFSLQPDGRDTIVGFRCAR